MSRNTRMTRMWDLLDAANRVDQVNRHRRRRHFRDTNDSFDLPDAEFISTYRLSKEVVRKLIEELSPMMSEGEAEVSISRKVLVSLAFYASGSYQRGIGQRQTHLVSQPTVCRAIKEVTAALNHRAILSKYIQFPQTVEERNNIKRMFYQLFNFPGVVGCIDGTHVTMIRPPENEEEFFNRKRTHSLNVQIICDAELNILSVDSSHGGATHDSAIWNVHPLKDYLERLHNEGESVWLLGDSGYPQREIMITPILDAEPNSPEARYTQMHVQTRNCVERCIGVLKGRWRCLLTERTLHYRPETSARIVNACVVLHNIARKEGMPVIPLSAEEAEDERRQNAEMQSAIQGRESATLAVNDPAHRRVDRALVAGRATRAAIVHNLNR